MTAQDMGFIMIAVVQILTHFCQAALLFKCHFCRTNSLQIPVVLDFSTITWTKPKTWQLYRGIISTVLKQYAFYLLSFALLATFEKAIPQLFPRPPALSLNIGDEQCHCLLIDITAVVQLAIINIILLYTARQCDHMHILPSNHLHEFRHVLLKINVWQYKAKRQWDLCNKSTITTMFCFFFCHILM